MSTLRSSPNLSGLCALSIVALAWTACADDSPADGEDTIGASSSAGTANSTPTSTLDGNDTGPGGMSGPSDNPTDGDTQTADDSADTGESDSTASGGTTSGPDPSDPFSFIVFGDLNGGGCDKNDRFHRLVPMMLDADPAFTVHTGDIIEGYGAESCFGSQPADTSCNDDNESGNMAQQMAPLLEATHDPELRASFFPVIGNHDGNWGSNWYPDPCGGGICELLGLNSAGIAETYVDHGDTFQAPGFASHNLNHGDICGLDQGSSGHPEDFYYAFPFRNSYFIMLRLHEDFSGMLDCNGATPGYDSCAEYCSAPELRLDEQRNSACYSVFQYDWLTAELEAASEAYAHVFVFAHAPLMGSGENHGPNSDASAYRALFDQYGVDAFFNGHNHAYERTVPLRNGKQDPEGTHYITVGTGGALTDTISGDAFTAYSYQEWTGYGDYEEMTSYLEVSVDGGSVSASVVTLSGATVDSFDID